MLVLVRIYHYIEYKITLNYGLDQALLRIFATLQTKSQITLKKYMPKPKKKQKSTKIKLQNISDFYLYQNDNDLCQFFIVNDENEKPNLVMIYKNFETESQILDFVEGIKFSELNETKRTLN